MALLLRVVVEARDSNQVAGRLVALDQVAEPAPGGRRWARGGRNIQDMLERLPRIAIADVKVGDTILVSSTRAQTLRDYGDHFGERRRHSPDHPRAAAK